MPARERADVVRRARALLGRRIHGHGVSVRITEVEAYGGCEDPASHAFTRTPRSEIMYGPAHRLYVYRSYGIHLCANVVTGPTEIGAAVLLRAGEVVEGLDLARTRRGLAAGKDIQLARGPGNLAQALDLARTRRGLAAGKDIQLARGPGNLAQALGITLDDLGSDLLDPASQGVRLGPEAPGRRRIVAGPRVGVSKAADVPWRFWIEGDPTVSAYRRSPRVSSPARSD